MLKTSNEIKQTISDRNSTVQAIIDIAKEESREFSADELATVNAWHGEGKEGGEFAKLEGQLEQAEKIEARAKKLATPTLVAALDAQAADINLEDGSVEKVKVPAKARALQKLVAFAGDSAEKEAYVSGMWFLALNGNDHAKTWCGNHGIEVRAHVEGTNSLGGFTVPAPLEAALIRIIVEHGKFRRYTTVKQMSSLTLTTPRRIGGLEVYYPDEASKIERSNMTFGNVVLTAKKYACRAKFSSELSEDSVLSMIDELTTEVGIAMAKAEDRNGFMGDGTAAYASTTGVNSALTAPSTVTASSATLASLTLSDFSKCEATIPDFTGMTPVWFMNKAVYYNAVDPLVLAAGGVNRDEMEGGTTKRFKGVTVEFIDSMPKAPASGEPIAFYGDLRMSSTLGDRRGMSFKLLTELYAEEDMIGLVSTKRVDIKVHEVGTAAAAAVAADTGNDLGAIAAVPAMAGPIVKLVAP